MRAAFYKGTRPMPAGIYNEGVRRMTKSPYSHCELVFSNGVAASASYLDGGVRFKQIEFSAANWDFIDLPAHREPVARQWFIDHDGLPYDLKGNAHFIIGAIGDDNNKWFCSEAIAAALGITDAWRYDPATLWSALHLIAVPKP